MSKTETKPVLKTLTFDEYRILKAIADRIVPEAGEKHGLDLAIKIDSLFAGLRKEFAMEFRLLLNLFEYGTPFFGATFKRFTQMDPAAQDRYLENWERSRFFFKRMGFQALKRTALSAFYGSERSWSIIGYRGPWLDRGYPHDYQGKNVPIHL